MRIYENPQKTSKNRRKLRSYCIPCGVSEYQLAPAWAGSGYVAQAMMITD
ncbi:MAG: hypothetical protein IJY91_04455 [Oscillospiraceae bacterium]|nr:hypothetical protein [Oscillospiraceae bacterium]